MPEVIAAQLTPAIAQRLVEACPTAAFRIEEHDRRPRLRLSYGKCIGCGRCFEPSGGAVVAAKSFSLCGHAKDQLVRDWDLESRVEITPPRPNPEIVRGQIHSLVGKALNIRQLDAGSCNGCEAEITALTNPYYDLERFGIHFVASPKHADMLLVTGPVTRNMTDAVKATYEAVPSPKLVVAVGACGCSGGIFAGSHAVVGAVDAVIPVDGYIPGCPPTPAMLITGIIEVLRRCVAK
jgi:Ni,Fe-hydrogenase III small subunit